MAWLGGLEIRQEADGTHTLTGRFPYGTETRLSSSMREKFAARALEADPDGNVMLLARHNFEEPLAAMKAGTLVLERGDVELRFEARLPEEPKQPTYMTDVVRMIRNGLMSGVSPGFNVVQDREVNGVREIVKAGLVELSLVVRPAYDKTGVSL